ncbi:4-(cytidine 5'-diphospho)-2-C-methyl-D-erythritol kinase [Phycisphaera mikurensis]|uniref:4-diphosphocytidyl-2-C-methyl-D-erythritol kinase n=1 Tax=Phycisphaera mikurensis (strain NBRC 102666 / KCTC 22515 / FYK2301M01) TaxID=1142394 RepID=I0ICG3_PHYMF|nr:4-diphosphocytidyl-2C-methyl-D-erythritol kinase [Phycisphaera mikurensis]MBB6442173.1 4-diphosphocytidyl-2-C-methyl-D-erythritol kinase [Phycisphaera mikurensis]BAM02951.1 4-diphosphocytidyl-2-C-methyl-D-erythritol kinase [Phycisphaera mikurensis NBRC 102666]
MSKAGEAVVLRCPAKLNLFLHVGPPAEAGGRHPVLSAMAAIDLVDDLEAERRDGAGLSLARTWAASAAAPTPLDWPAERDLAWRAAEAFAAEAGTRPDVRLTLSKRIPCGGGLGGGSADAAGVLAAMDRLWPGAVEEAALTGLAAGLGSDVPFALAAIRGRPLALVGGFGEAVQPLPRPPGAGLHAALVFPAFGCPTGSVFAAFDAAPPAGRSDPGKARAAAEAGWRALAALGNALAEPACAVRPALRRVLEALAGAGLDARITGSGSTVFVLAEDAAQAADAARRAGAATGLPAVAVSGWPR